MSEHMPIFSWGIMIRITTLSMALKKTNTMLMELSGLRTLSVVKGGTTLLGKLLGSARTHTRVCDNNNSNNNINNESIIVVIVINE